MSYQNLIIFLLLFCTLSEAYTVSYSIQNPNRSNLKQCSIDFSIDIGSLGYKLIPTDFTVVESGYNLTNINYFSNNTNQVFIFNLKWQNAVNNANVYIYNINLKIFRSSDPNFPVPSGITQAINGLQCKSMENLEFRIIYFGTTVFDYQYPMIYQTIKFNFSQPISNDFSGVICKTTVINSLYCEVVKSVNGYYILKVPMIIGYLSGLSIIQLTLIYDDNTIYHNINTPFPYRSSRTSIIEDFTIYPKEGSIMEQNYLFQKFSESICITIKNCNSIVQFNNFQTVDYIPILYKNQTHTVFYTSIPLTNITIGDQKIFLLDTTSTLYNNTYSSTTLKPNYNPSVQWGTIQNDDTNITFVRINSDNTFVRTFESVVTLLDSPGFLVSRSSKYPTLKSLGRYLYFQYIPISSFMSSRIFAYNSSYSDSKQFSFSSSIVKSDPNLYINDIKFISTSVNSFIIRVNISSNYPIYSISFSPIYCNNVPYLVYGTEYQGIYEVEVIKTVYSRFDMTIITPRSTHTFTSELPYNNFNKFPSIILNELITFANFSYFSFENYNVDLTMSPYFVLNFNLSSPNIVNTPREINLYIKENQQYYPASYNTITNTYMFNVSLTNHLNIGLMNYEIYVYPNIPFRSVELSSFLGATANLNITNTNKKYYNPTVSDLNIYLGGPIDTTPIGWNLTIREDLLGIFNGTIFVVSNYSSDPIELYFDNSNLVSGDKFNGIYLIKFMVQQPCISQVFQISNITIFDPTNNFKSVPFDLYTALISNSISYNDIMYIECQPTMVDTTAPELKDIKFNTILDVGTLDRYVEFNVSIFESTTGSGISKSPIVQLTSENSDYFEIETQLVSSEFGIYNFTGKAQLPIGFGMNYIFVGLTRLVDNFYNYNTIYPDDIKYLSKPYYISRVFGLVTPHLFYSSYLDTSGGSLTVHGRSFGVDSNTIRSEIDYKDGKGFQPIQMDFHSGIVLQYNNRIPPIKADKIFLRIYNNQIQSNILTIPVVAIPNFVFPTETPTTTPNITETPSTSPNITITPSSTPQKCLGTPECNNHGTCINSICQCNLPWYGPSCSSQVQINPPPTPNSEPSIETTIVESKNLITSSIDIVGIREMNSNMEVVEFFNISSWNFTDQTISNISNPKFHYSTQLKSRSTILNVTIEYFRNTTNFTFADEELLLPASTIKFTMNLNSYSFKSSTNLIQILMKSTIETDQSNVCSSIGVGNEDGSVQWINLNVGDRSLYGRFLSKGIIDNVVRPIQNLIIEDDKSEQTKQFRSATVGITVPKYEDFVYLDPDFSNLIDVDSKDTANEICSSSSKKLSNGAIAGIVVGGVIFISVALAGVILYLKNKKYHLQEIKMKHRVENKKV